MKVVDNAHEAPTLSRLPGVGEIDGPGKMRDAEKSAHSLRRGSARTGHVTSAYDAL